MIERHRGLFMVLVVGAAVLMWGMWQRHPATHAQEPASRPTVVIWQSLKHAGGPKDNTLYRASVPGGWLVWIHRHGDETANFPNGVGKGIGMSSGLTFVPDTDHGWN